MRVTQLSGLPLAGILLTAVLAIGCDQTMSPDGSGTAAVPATLGIGSDYAGLTPDLQKQLAELRSYASGMHTVELAAKAGFDTPVTDCREKPGVGGMGFHYANLARIFDGSAPQITEPEILVFSPGKNGRVRLGAVEYFIPYALWADVDPPELLGQEFHPNDGDGGWMLHVWLWNRNPAGLFADFNPNVSCG